MNNTRVATPVILSDCDRFPRSKEKAGMLVRAPGAAGGGLPAGGLPAGGGVGACAAGCCSGAYHFPSEACHQPGPCETSLIATSRSAMVGVFRRGAQILARARRKCTDHPGR